MAICYPTKRSNPAGLALLGLGVLALVAVLQIMPSPHALERHGTDAEIAVAGISAAHSPYHHPCTDGRTRFVEHLRDVTRGDPKSWAIVVCANNAMTIEECRMITAFLATESYARDVMADCEGSTPDGHPAMTNIKERNESNEH